MDPVVFDGSGRMGAKALDPRNPSAKIKQNMFDYALWHGQGAYIEKLAREAKFAAALPLTHEGDLLGRFERTLYGWRFVNPSKDDGFADDPKNPMGRATRAVAAMRERLLRPYSSARRKAYCKTAVSTGSTTGPIAARRP